VLDRVYRAVAWQRVDVIRYSIMGSKFCIFVVFIRVYQVIFGGFLLLLLR
jgi:hypothetical protein